MLEWYRANAGYDAIMADSVVVIAHAAQLGLDRVIGDALGFVRADAAVLDSDIFAFLPREKMVLELTDSLPATPALLARISELKTHGFRFALTGVVAGAAAVFEWGAGEFVTPGRGRGSAGVFDAAQG